jgi:ketosteroid isomerase-like protein
METADAASVRLCNLLNRKELTMAGPVEDEVRAAYRKWDEAFNRSDAAAVAAAYLADAKLLPPTHAVIDGPAEIRKFFASLFDSGVSGHKLELIEAGGDAGFAYGCAKWSARTKDAKEVGGIATHIFDRQSDGVIKLKVHTFN